MLSPVDHQSQDLLMSVLRMLSFNPDLASDPTIPKVQQKSSGSLMNIQPNYLRIISLSVLFCLILATYVIQRF